MRSAGARGTRWVVGERPAGCLHAFEERKSAMVANCGRWIRGALKREREVMG